MQEVLGFNITMTKEHKKIIIFRDKSISSYGYFVRLNEESYFNAHFCFTLWGAKRLAKKLLRNDKIEIIMEVKE